MTTHFPQSESITVALTHRPNTWIIGYVTLLKACHRFYYKKNITVLSTKRIVTVFVTKIADI